MAFECLHTRRFADQIHQDPAPLFCTLALAIYYLDVSLK